MKHVLISLLVLTVGSAALAQHDFDFGRNTRYKFVPIYEGHIELSKPNSAVIDVSKFREVVVYVKDWSFKCPFTSLATIYLDAWFRPDSKSTFGTTGRSVSFDGGRLKIDGGELQFRLGSHTNLKDCKNAKVSFSVSGIAFVRPPKPS